MKLHRLIIHNIASIIDADIDFEAEPLASSDLFLISGNTGSGKTTILDCICLALFGKTPRLDKAKRVNRQERGMKVDDGKKSAKNLDEKIDDPRHMMRNNTVEAHIKLYFKGSNNIDYLSEWSVERANRKAGGNIKDVVYSLTFNKNGTQQTIQNKTAVMPEIEQAIGLTFEQFCRTTMLAQNDFTRFLNSDQSEKSEILEKITGTEIYTKIGKRIHSEHGIVKRQFEEADMKVQNVELLTEEQRSQLLEQLEQLDLQYKSTSDNKKGLESKLQWIKTTSELEQQLEMARQKYSNAKATVDTDDFRQQQELLTDWNSTSEQRDILKQHDEASAEIIRQQQLLLSNRKRYTDIIAGLAHHKQRLSDARKKIADMTAFIKQEEPRKAVFEQEKSFVALLEEMSQKEREVLQLDKEIDADTKALETAQMKQQETIDKEQASRQDFDNASKILEQCTKDFDNCRLTELRKQREQLHKSRQQCLSAQLDLRLFLNESQLLKEESEQAEKLKKDKATKERELAMLPPLIAEADKNRAVKQAVCDTMKESVGKWAKSIRATLKADDICPVCRQRITGAIPHDDEIESLFADAKQQLDNSEKELRTLKEQQTTLTTQISTLDISISDKTANIAILSEKHAATRLKAVETCGTTELGDDTMAMLRKNEEELTKQIDKADSEIAKAEQTEARLQNQRTAVDQARKKLDEAKKEKDDARNDVLKASNSIKLNQSKQKSLGDSIDAMKAKVAQLLATSMWSHDWTSQRQDFVEELKESAAKYRRTVEKKAEWESSCDKEEAKQEALQKDVDNIAAIMPEWKESVQPALSNQPEQSISALQDDLTDVGNKVSAAKSALDAATEKINLCNKQLDDYFSRPDAVSPDRLSDLSKTNIQTVNQMQQQRQQMLDKVTEATTLLSNCEEKLKQHLQAKPAIADDETPDRLQAAIATMEETLRTTGETAGGIRQRLSTDQQQQEKLKELIDERDKRKKVYDRWNYLKEMLGDESGKKFRNIAQSYILANLIHSANSYMKTLSDRYTLHVNPGSFIIYVEDAWEGFQRRPANNISGGESFLVSLALALALSDIGHHLTVNILFIDEGFGSLSGEPLMKAIDTLRALRSHTGRHVGIISHIAELRERIPVQIQVLQEGTNSSSQIKIVP